MTETRWAELEAWLAAVAFAGLARKNGQPMVNHSLRIGRALVAAGADDISIFGGYCHDVLEDCPHVSETDLRQMAKAVLGAEAPDGVQLVAECSYTAAEYALPKAARKAAAVARWCASPDFRVHLVKQADVADNRADAGSVSPAFEAEYLSWAEPLQARLTELLAARLVVGRGPVSR